MQTQESTTYRLCGCPGSTASTMSARLSVCLVQLARYMNPHAHMEIGVVVGSWVSKHWGRRMCMFTMSIWAIICATIVITSKTKEQILVARILNCTFCL